MAVDRPCNFNSSARCRSPSRIAPSSWGLASRRSLLALLLLHANQVVSTDRLIDELWGDVAAGDGRQERPGLRLAAPQGARRGAARHAAARLRAAASGPAELDLARFERLRGEARRRDPRAPRDAPRGARAVARAAARRPRLRAVRPGRDRAPRGAAARRARGAHRRRPRRRPPRASWSPSSRRSSPSIRCGSGCAAS